MHKDYEVVVTSEKDVRIAEAYAKEISEEVYVIVSELSTNVLKHSKDGKGTLQMSNTSEYIHIKLTNEGSLNTTHFIDGKTTISDSLGIGLGAVGRLSDELTYSSDNGLVEINVKKYLKEGCKFQTACLSYAKVGLEDFNGDTFVKVDKKNSVLLGVVDILGHGKVAHKSAIAVKRFIEHNNYLDLEELIYELHNHLKGEGLRGGMVALARINTVEKILEFCGIGDSSIRIFAENSTSLLTADGVVGETLRRKLIKQKVDLPEKAIISLFTDGISSRIEIPYNLMNSDLLKLVHLLMEKYARDDDRTLMLARLDDIYY